MDCGYTRIQTAKAGLITLVSEAVKYLHWTAAASPLTTMNLIDAELIAS